VKQRDGRRNRYQIEAYLPLAEPGTREPAIGEVLALLGLAAADQPDGPPGGAAGIAARLDGQGIPAGWTAAGPAQMALLSLLEAVGKVAVTIGPETVGQAVAASAATGARRARCTGASAVSS
jgi:hypothetical protein